MPIDIAMAQRRAARKVLHKEFTDFFVTMTTADDTGWPNISDQELVNGIADALITMGERSHKGVALLQTLVHELQDRINFKLK